MIKFGPSGNSERFYLEGHLSTAEAALWVRDNGLDCFEYSFGRGVRIGESGCENIKNAFIASGTEISVHAPYYINFANPDDETAENSFNHVFASASACRLMGGKRVVFHPASVGKVKREEAFAKTKERFLSLANRVHEYGYEDMLFCPETMGKLNQIGTAEEIAELCAIDDCFVPTIDFGHVNARGQGVLKTASDYEKLLCGFIDTLGYERMRNFHAHFSKIEYTKMGEKKHLTFADTIYGPEFEPLAEAIIKLKLEPYIVCESDGTQADDAITMKSIYSKLIKETL